MLAVTQRTPYVSLEVVNAYVNIVFQQCHAPAHAVHAVARQLLSRRRYAARHVVHVGIKKHCAVYYVTAGYVIKCRARHLPAFYQDVVTAVGCRLDAHSSEHKHHHLHVAVERKAHVVATCYEREHHVVIVGIHATAAALSPEHAYAVALAIIHVYLIAYKLVAPEHYGRLNLPVKQAVVGRDVTRHKFLHG